MIDTFHTDHVMQEVKLGKHKLPNLKSLITTFQELHVGKLDISGLEAENLETLDKTFNSVTVRDLKLFNTASVKYWKTTFSNFSYANGSILLDTSNALEFEGTFICATLDTLTFTDTSKVKHFNATFNGATIYAVNNISIESLETPEDDFEHLGLFRYSKVKHINFCECRPKIKKLSKFFQGSIDLETVNMKDVYIDEVTSIISMFDGCKSLREVDMRHINFADDSVVDALAFCNVPSTCKIYVNKGVYDILVNKQGAGTKVRGLLEVADE